jgi:hypothetical protein
MAKMRSLFSKLPFVSAEAEVDGEIVRWYSTDMEPNHQIDFNKTTHQWGRGIYHIPTKTVYMWEEQRMTHASMARNLGFEDEHCEGLYASPWNSLLDKGWEISCTGSFFDTIVYDKEELRAILDSLGFDTKYL